MIYDTLGILIGFVYVMLILSIVVTAIVEATQNFFRLRMRNLFKGLDNLLNSRLITDISTKEMIEEKTIQTKNLIEFVKFVPVAASGGPLKKIIDFFTPQIDRIEAEDVIEYLKAQEINIEDRKAEFVRKFRSMEHYLSESFKIKVKLISLVASLIVAFVFQINTFDFIQKLSTDATYRTLLVSMAEDQYGGVERISGIASDKEVFQSALQSLITEHEKDSAKNKKLQNLLTEIESNKFSLDIETGTVRYLDLFPNKKEAKEELENAIDQTRLDILAKAPDKIVDKLNAFSEIRPFPSQGWVFYKSFSNWVGTITTAILISLGAHFWFDSLKTLLGLRNKLQNPNPSPTPSDEQKN